MIHTSDNNKGTPFSFFSKVALASTMLLGWSTLDSSAITVTASDAQVPNVPANVLDNNLSTRWSAFGDPQWIQFDFLSIQTVASVDIAFFAGDQRGANFDIETSVDGITWSLVYMGQSSAQTVHLERYDIVDVEARFVRIVGHGNTNNLWNSITEVEIDTYAVSTLASSFQTPNVPANTLDDDLSTRWSSDGLGEWIRFDLGATRFVSSLGVAFFQGDARQAFLDIEASGDGVNWLPLRSVVSSGDSLDLERFSFPEVSARYIRLVGQGNTWNDWNSYTEVDVSNPTPTWSQVFSGSDSGTLSDVTALPGGEVVAVGNFPGDTVILRRFDAFGAERFSFNDNGSSFAGDVSNPFLVASNANEDLVFIRSQAPTSTGYEDSNVIVTKLLGSGGWQWNRILGSSFSVDLARDLEAMPNGTGYVIAGGINGNVDGEWDAWFTKLNNSGNTVWSKTYTDASLIGPGEIFVEGLLFDATVTDQNDFLVTGNFTAINTTTSERKVYQRALRLNSNGDIIWHSLINEWAEPNIGYITAILSRYHAVELRDGSDNFVLVELDYPENYRIAILDSAGGLGSWSTAYFGIPSIYNNMTADSDGGFSIVHSTLDDNYGLRKFESDGTLVWGRAFGDASVEGIFSMVRTTDEGYALVGNKGGAPLVLKLDAGGSLNQ